MDYGAINKLKCPRCSNNVSYHLIRTRTWFTYFFIPIFPYKTEYNAECPICTYSIKLLGEEVEAARHGTLNIRVSPD